MILYMTVFKFFYSCNYHLQDHFVLAQVIHCAAIKNFYKIVLVCQKFDIDCKTVNSFIFTHKSIYIYINISKKDVEHTYFIINLSVY